MSDEERIIIPLTGEAQLNRVDAEAMRADRSFLDLIGERKNRISFLIGEDVKRISKEFWECLLGNALGEHIDEMENELTLPNCNSLLDATINRFKLEYGDISTDERNLELSLIADIFVNKFLGPYTSYMNEMLNHLNYQSIGGGKFAARCRNAARIYASKVERHIAIPVNGNGILDDRDALSILANDEYRYFIEHREAEIAFIIGRDVTATSPEFWSTLLSDTLRKIKSRLERETNPPAAKNISHMIDVKFRLKYEDDLSAPIERLLQLNKIAHRFEGIVTPYQQFAVEWIHAFICEDIGRPDMASQARQRATHWAAAIDRGFG